MVEPRLSRKNEALRPDVCSGVLLFRRRIIIQIGLVYDLVRIIAMSIRHLPSTNRLVQPLSNRRRRLNDTRPWVSAGFYWERIVDAVDEHPLPRGQRSRNIFSPAKHSQNIYQIWSCASEQVASSARRLRPPATLGEIVSLIGGFLGLYIRAMRGCFLL